MQLTEFRPLLLNLLARENALPDAPTIWHTLALYCCRLITKSQFRVWVHSKYRGQPTLRDSLLELKDRLDLNSISNRVLRAVYDLSNFKRRPKARYKSIAAKYRLAVKDLWFLERSLNKEERSELRWRWQEGIGKELTPKCTAALAEHYDKVVQYLVYRHLSYVYNNDPAIQFCDICGDMKAEVVRLAMHYEVYLPAYYSVEHFLRSIHRGLVNKAKNLAKLYGRKGRCGVERIHKASTSRELWYLTKHLRVYRVVVNMKQEARRMQDGVLETLALFRSGKSRWIPVAKLYESRDDAKKDRFVIQQCGKPAARPLLSLAPYDIDDFRLTAKSLDAPVTGGGDDSKESTFHNLTASVTVPSTSAKTFLVDLSRAGASKELQDFANVVVGDYRNQVFSKWLHVYRGREIGTLSDEQLGVQAAKWVGVSIKQLRNDLAATSSTIWGSEERAVISSYLDSHQGEDDAS